MAGPPRFRKSCTHPPACSPATKVQHLVRLLAQAGALLVVIIALIAAGQVDASQVVVACSSSALGGRATACWRWRCARACWLGIALGLVLLLLLLLLALLTLLALLVFLLLFAVLVLLLVLLLLALLVLLLLLLLALLLVLVLLLLCSCMHGVAMHAWGLFSRQVGVEVG